MQLPRIFKLIENDILHLRDSGLVLIRLAELKQRMELALLGERFELAELQTVVGLLAGPGMIQRVDFGGFVLLRRQSTLETICFDEHPTQRYQALSHARRKLPVRGVGRAAEGQRS